MHYKHARRRTYGALMVRDVLRRRQCGIDNAGMDYSPVIYKDCFSAVFPASAVLYSCTCRLIEERNDFHDFPLGAMKSAGVIEMPVTRVYPLFALQSAMLFI